jgi:hypothetical protein
MIDTDEYGPLAYCYPEGNPEVLGEKPAHCHFVHRRSYVDWPGVRHSKGNVRKT